MVSQVKKDRIKVLANRYTELVFQQPKLNREIAEAELPETVYNSNAIENSTLTLQDTEDVLLRGQIRTVHEVREIYEARNLAKVIQYLTAHPGEVLSVGLILKLHRMLLEGIDDQIAGRFRFGRETVQAGSHGGANPALVNGLMTELVKRYNATDDETYFLERIARFHAELEKIHPFLDGNGRLGRVLINRQLEMLGLPPVIIPAKTKQSDYFALLAKFDTTGDVEPLTEVLADLLIEALYRRITRLEAHQIVPVAEWAKKRSIDPKTATSRAARGTIPAFRVDDHWMIEADYEPEVLAEK